MLDLVGQQEGIRERLEEAVLEVIAEGSYISTERLTPFEEKLAAYCGRPHAVAVASGSTALHLALLACGIGAGQEVVTVPNSFFATVEAILHVGARPRFVDVDPDTHLLALDKLPSAITERTRAVLPVHLYGNVVDVEAILRVLESMGRSDVVVIEDCAHAMGARLRGRTVPLGGVGAFSFNPVKNLGALGDAGAVVTSDARVAEAIRLLRDHGRSAKSSHVMAGFNSRLDRINDRVLALKLDYLDEWNDRRREIARLFDAAFAHLTPYRASPESEPSYHQYVICPSRRKELRRHLDELGIATAIHYPRLIPEQEPLRRLGYTVDGLDSARQLNRRILSIPCHPELADADVDRIVEAVTSL